MGDDWVEVFLTYDTIESEMIKDLLESGGIETVLRSSKVGPFPVNIGKMGEIKVLVRKEDEEPARRLIAGEQDNPSSS